MSKRDPLQYVEDMLDACRSVLDFTREMTFDEFASDDRTNSAVVRKLEVIGEAARQLPDNLREQHTSIPWREVIGFRNVAVHGYYLVDLRIVWTIVQNDIPAMIPHLERMLSEQHS